MTSEPSDRSWPGLLEALLAGHDLSAGDTAWAMDQVMSGTAGAARLAALLVALRAKGEVAEEIKGLVEAMLGHAVPLTVAGPTLDIVGTGGDGAHSVNVSTMSAVVAAGAGARVVKHGNRSASSPCGVSTSRASRRRPRRKALRQMVNSHRRASLPARNV